VIQRREVEFSIGGRASMQDLANVVAAFRMNSFVLTNVGGDLVPWSDGRARLPRLLPPPNREGGDVNADTEYVRALAGKIRCNHNNLGTVTVPITLALDDARHVALAVVVPRRGAQLVFMGAPGSREEVEDSARFFIEAIESCANLMTMLDVLRSGKRDNAVQAGMDWRLVGHLLEDGMTVIIKARLDAENVDMLVRLDSIDHDRRVARGYLMSAMDDKQPFEAVVGLDEVISIDLFLES